MQLEGEEPYEYKYPVQQPIAPPYSSFLKLKSLDEHKITEDTKNLFTSKTVTIDTLDLDKMLQELIIVDDKANIAENCSTAESISLLQTETNSADYTDQLGEELEVSHEILSPPSGLQFGEKEQVNPNQDNTHLTQTLSQEGNCGTESAEGEKSEVLGDLKVVEEGSSNKDNIHLAQTLLEEVNCEINGKNFKKETHVYDESDIMKIVKKAIFAKQLIATDDFLIQLDKVFSIDSKKDLSYKCMCTEDPEDYH